MSEMLQQAKKLRDVKLARSGGGDTNNLLTKSSSTVQAQSQSSAKSQRASDATKTNGHSSPANSTNMTTQPQNDNSPKPCTHQNTAPPDQKQKKDFGGMKKGFLFGGPKSNTGAKSKSDTKTETSQAKGASSCGSQTESIPFIKAKAGDEESSLKLTEVQEAMQSAQGFLQDKDWVTDDLLQKVTANDVLAKRLNDPQFVQAINEFQTNPQAAMAKYQSSPEVQDFLKEFCGVMGEHFAALGDKEGKPTTRPTPTQTGPKITEVTEEDRQAASMFGQQGMQVPVDPQVRQILSDPANQEILMDPNIQKLIQHLRNNPDKAQRMLREAESSFRQKVDRLVSLGLLKLQAS